MRLIYLKVQGRSFCVSYIRIIFLIFHFSNFSTSQTLSPSAQFTLLTCDPGEQLYSLFGHSAIRLQDPVTGTDRVYNYGTFDFDEPNFGIKFLRGKLLYALGISTFDQFIREYQYYERGVKEQLLNLDHESKLGLFQFLEENYEIENRYYLYDFFFDNCSSRIRDVFEEILKEYNYENTINRNLTYRELIHKYLTEKKWLAFGIDLIIGSLADKQASWRDQMFLPDYLHDNMESFVYSGNGREKQLIAYERQILDYPRLRGKRPFSCYLSPFYAGIFLLFLDILIWFKPSWFHPLFVKIYDRIWLALLSIASLIISFMWIGTDHQACSRNWNLLWANPLFCLLPVFSGIRKINLNKWTIWVLIGCLCLMFPGILFIPQAFHPAVWPIVFITLLKLLRRIRLRSADNIRGGMQISI